MRNVITLSDIPKDLHDWLKIEASRRSKLSGKRVGIYQVVTQAVEEYMRRVEKPSRRHGSMIPTVELFRKKIQPSEIVRGCVCVPKAQWFYFGTVGNTIAMKDAKDDSTCRVPVRSQFRLDMRNWYRQHSNIKSGDEIVFEHQDGNINIRALTI